MAARFVNIDRDTPLLLPPDLRDWDHDGTREHEGFLHRPPAETSAVDDGVGEILAALEENGVGENTLVVYASDQGWMGGQNGFFGMGDHTKPTGAHDLMMQVTLIFRQPGTVAAGTSDLLVSNYDFLPSVLDQLGLEHRIPADANLPGHSFAAVLKGKTIGWTNEMIYEMEGCRSYRDDRWKIVLRRFPTGPSELYDLQSDPDERFNLFGQPDLAEKQAELISKLEAKFTRFADPEYDLWKGGRSKAKLHTPRQ